MASESIAYSAFSLMGYWLRAHSGSSNNNYSSRPHGLWVNSLFGLQPLGLLTQSPFRLKEQLLISLIPKISEELHTVICAAYYYTFFSNVALKKQHKARWNCNMGKYQPGRGTWPTPQNGKWTYLKFRLRTYIPPLPTPPNTWPTRRQTYAWLCLISHCIFCSLFLYFCTEFSWQYNTMHKFVRALDNPPPIQEQTS